MNRQLTQYEILVHDDCVQLFLGKDQFGMQYLCLLSEITNESDTYLCAPISLTRLDDFYYKNGDLRSIYKDPETDELFTINISDPSSEKFNLLPINVDDVPEAWLPEEGFVFVKDKPSEPEGKIIEDNHQKKPAIIELVGILNKVDLRRKSWTLISTKNKKTYNGSLSKGVNVSLSGVIIETQVYRFVCEEKLEITSGSSEEKTRLYLLEYQPLY